MKKRHLIFFFFLWMLCVEHASAQFDAQFSHYMEVPETNNPGAVAANEMMNLYGMYRIQWAGFSDAPEDMFFSVDMPLTISGTKHGIGLVFSSENIGLFNNQSVLLEYSYKIKLWRGVLGLGLNIGWLSQTFDNAAVDFTGSGNTLIEGDDYHSTDDAYAYSGVEDNANAFDVGFGCFYKDDDLFAGLSVSHLNSNTTNYGIDSALMYVPRIFYLTGGYNIRLPNPFYTLKPSTQMRTDFESSQIELSCLLEYDKRIRGGLSYRFGDAFVFLVGIDLFSGLSLGYSYDLPVSKMIMSGGSHEVYMRYSFKPEFSKKNKYKSDRIL
ncbi:MAG TPA: PorP/SprF family type IX secretion system membrane protein [Paludibacteraceae bacterium]|nr:PorP/SprF family type IX secretion system membrane protein [Paludibacteraceae bacterium]